MRVCEDSTGWFIPSVNSFGMPIFLIHEAIIKSFNVVIAHMVRSCWCKLPLGKWRITSLDHAMKFELILKKYSVFSVLWRISVLLPLHRGFKECLAGCLICNWCPDNSKIKVKCYKSNHEPKSLLQEIKFPENLTIPRIFQNQ